MTFRGKVQGGVIILEDGESLPEGITVEVYAFPSEATSLREGPAKEGGRTLSERYAAFIGIAPDLPPDMSLNHDHYLYGCPKK